ncbi:MULTISPECIES: hypothetical protein [unclassified Rhodococcus (in: high G+C Gram-positive bacteria)]|nr:hypothetical protein [Rhodococcus sp. DK17]
MAALPKAVQHDLVDDGRRDLAQMTIAKVMEHNVADTKRSRAAVGS